MRSELTGRETQVLALVAEGNTDKEVAQALGTGAETVKTQLRSIRRVLHARTRTHAVAIAIRRGLI